mgnify:CR=1 FL=1
MLGKLKKLYYRFDEIVSLLSQEEVFQDSKKFQELSKEQATLAPFVKIYTELSAIEKTIKENYLNQYKGNWDQEEIDRTAAMVANGAIKYGMIRVDNNRKIVFDMKEWLKLDGETGPYLQYVYARIQSLIDKIGLPEEPQNFNRSILEKEQEKYSEYRKQYAKSRGKKGEVNPAAEAAIHNARRIVRSASAKIPFAVKTVGDKFEIGKFWLVYCDNSVMLNRIRTGIAEEYPHFSHLILEYSSKNLSTREMNLKKFQSEGGILLAMKCLDEGVSIEQISHGLVLSSSTVEREFIQRRGRMLRKAKGKTVAEIYDLVTEPHQSASESEKESILKHELSRIESFSNIITSTLPFSQQTLTVPVQDQSLGSL